MPRRTFAGGGLRVSYPSTHTATGSVRAATRGLPGDPTTSGTADPAHDALLAALDDAGFQPVEQLQLTPKRTRALDPVAAITPASLTIELDARGDEDAVVLLEQDGCYTWHLPASSQAQPRRRRLPGERHTASFTIDLRVGAPPLAAAPVALGMDAEGRPVPRTRGLLGDLVSGVVRVAVLRFAAPWLAGGALDVLERSVQPGIVHLRTPQLPSWTRVDRLDQIPLPGDRPARVLLLVHGTFSSTVHAFAEFGLAGEAARFLEDALREYDAVIGFDHPTLSVDPLANAADLLERISGLPTAVTFDVICHSRGGLTTRSFVEQVLPAAGGRARVDRVVFVAATNSGTALADPERWADLIDLTTNLAAASARALATIPGAAPVGVVLAGVVPGLGALVKYLASYALAEGGVPGLAAMTPEGPFITELNRTQPGQPGPGTPCYVVSSDFHVTLLDDSHRPPEFPREFAVRVAEGLADQIFRGPNDLVVDIGSMGIGHASGQVVAGECALGTNDVVYHGNYFGQAQVVQALGHWLGLASGSAAIPQLAQEEAVQFDVEELAVGVERPARGRDLAERPTRGRDLAERPTRGRDLAERPARGRDLAEPPNLIPTTGGGPDSADDVPELVGAHVLAELPAAPAALERCTLAVRLARRELEATPGLAHAVADLVVRPTSTLSVQVVPKLNARIDGADRDVFDLPRGGGESTLEFAVVPLDIGALRVDVVVRDGDVPLAVLHVQAQAVVGGPAADSGTARVVADLPPRHTLPGFGDGLQLEVVEARTGQACVLEYTVKWPLLGIVERYTSPNLADREAYVASLFRDIRRLAADLGDRPADLLAGLQDRGAQLCDEVFPPELQRLLWEHRTELADMVLLTDEPYLPWELVHLKPPNRARGRTPAFLGQLGMIRWQFAGRYPGRELRARDGRVLSLCPDYLDPQYVLTEPAQEAQFLVDRFHARPAPASDRQLRALLRRGGFDVLHFAGHGLSDNADIATARIMLAGRPGPTHGSVLDQYLTAVTVAQNARLRSDDGSGPLVVLNACQSARGGRQLSSLGGFATAFLEAGASAYVSTLWSVGDEPARTFVEAFYEALLAGRTVREATVTAREAARAAGDASWLAYVVYAQPEARLVTG